MAKEIERKFLVREEILIPYLEDPAVQRKLIAQYYLVSSKDAAVRIRRTSGMEHAVLTVKSGGNGISTDEFEFDVPLSEYLGKLSDRVGHEIVKTRHLVVHGGRTWEVDVFGGALEGLVVAELECDDAAEVTDLPDWVGEEVTYDSRYKNAVLALKGRPEEDSPEMIASLETTLAALGELDGPLLDFETEDGALQELRAATVDPFSSDSRIGFDADGMTEALMFAPGDAIFATRQPLIDQTKDLSQENADEIVRGEIWRKPASEIFGNDRKKEI